MDLFTVIIILISGLFAGFLNVIAGGGSLITLPMLIFLGMPSATANGTNRVALMAQNIVAIASFKKSGYFDWRLGVMLGIPAIIGSIIGANAAIHIPEEWFNRLLSIVMILVLITIIWKPQKKLTSSDRETYTPLRKLLMIITFLFVGFYGGFVQAGVGFIIIASLTLLSGMSLVKINSLKVFIVAFYMLSSLIIFIIYDQVNWGYGLILAVGTSIGAWLGSQFAVKKGEGWIRIILVVVVIFMAIKLWMT